MPADRPRLPIGLMAIGSEMAGATVLGVVLDVWVFGTLPWATIVLTVLGFATAFYHLIAFAKKSSGSSPSNDRGKP